MRKVFFGLNVLLIIAIVLQFYFAGMGVFSMPEDELFAIHGTSGRIVLPILVILWIVAAAFARAGGGTIGLTLLTFGLLAMQTVLFILAGVLTGATPPPDAQITMAGTIMLAFHVINGLAILWVSLVVLRRARALAFPAKRGAVTEAEPAMPTT